MRDVGSNAHTSSIVLVCRPRVDDVPFISRHQFVDVLQRKLSVALKEMQSGNIAPLGLAQASIDPDMAIYSRYSKVPGAMVRDEHSRCAGVNQPGTRRQFRGAGRRYRRQ